MLLLLFQISDNPVQHCLRIVLADQTFPYQKGLLVNNTHSIAGQLYQGWEMSDIKMIAQHLFPLTISNPQVVRSLHLQKLASILFGVRATRAVQKKMHLVNCLEDELNIAGGDLYDSVLCGKSKQAEQNGDYDHQFNISNVLYDTFSDLRDMMVKENEMAIERISFNSLAIGQQNEMINLLVFRSRSLLDRFTNLVNQLCQVMTDKGDTIELIIHAKQQVQAEKMQWLQLENDLNARGLMLTTKCKGKRSRQKRQKYYSKAMSKIETAMDDQVNAKSSDTIKFQEGGQLDYKAKIKKQFAIIKQFVVDNLSPKIQYRPNSEIPKKIILNVYLRWNRQAQRCLQISDTGKIQMELTNQLKICFPKMQMTRKTFKGVQFRSELIEHLQLTDRLLPINQEESLLDQDDLDPIDDILKEYQQNKEEEGQE